MAHGRALVYKVIGKILAEANDKRMLRRLDG